VAGFENQAVLVTGASRGIGRAVAMRFARAGAHVAVNFRTDAAGAQETVALIAASGGAATAVQADVALPADLERMVSGIEGRIGPIEALVNNAAAFNRTPFLDLSLDEFDTVWATNGRGLFYLSQLVARRMAARGHGAIVHISSLLAQQTIPGRTAYAASKGAVESLTRAMALDLAPHGIRVNAVAPGLIRTEALLAAFPTEASQATVQHFIPFKRFGEPEELAEAVHFLASPAASYITGALLPVNAGLGVLEAGPR
jgi:NAD(P)-dependent dehydrogenase (short-subunit alcohol dehydrogenase family)